MSLAWLKWARPERSSFIAKWDGLRQPLAQSESQTNCLPPAAGGGCYDGISALIYFSLLGGQEDRMEALAGLRSATGFIRAKVGKQLNLRFVPSIEFNYDDAEDEARRIDALLNSVKE